MRRARQSEEALAARREKEKAKLKEYLALTEDVLAKVNTKFSGYLAFDIECVSYITEESL